MRIFRQLLPLLLVFCSSLFFACEKVDVTNPPVVVLDCYELNVDGGGGDIALFYAVSNAIKGEHLTVKSNVDWIKPGEIGSSKIILHVESSNISEERFGFVTISYPYMEDDIKVYILQDKQLLNQYRFEISDLTYNSCSVSYIPSDENRPYMANIIDFEYFKQSGISDERMFIEAEMNNYLALAQRNNMSLEELMQRVSPQLIFRGVAERQFVGMQPGATYIVYSYGVEFHGNSYDVTTPLHSMRLELPMPSMYDVKFSIYSSISGNVASLSIDPGSWSGYYSVQIVPEDSIYYVEQGSYLSDKEIKALASMFYTNARKAMSSGASAEQFMRSSCYTGFGQITVPLDNARRYMVIVFAVESKNGEVPIMRSVPSLYYLS